MNDQILGREQARLLCRTIDHAHLGLGEVWFHYFSTGGNLGQLEVKACLHHSLSLPTPERDVLAHAVNELIAHRPVLCAPYSCELTDTQATGNTMSAGDVEKAKHGGQDETDGP